MLCVHKIFVSDTKQLQKPKIAQVAKNCNIHCNIVTASAVTNFVHRPLSKTFTLPLQILQLTRKSCSRNNRFELTRRYVCHRYNDSRANTPTTGIDAKHSHKYWHFSYNNSSHIAYSHFLVAKSCSCGNFTSITGR